MGSLVFPSQTPDPPDTTGRMHAAVRSHAAPAHFLAALTLILWCLVLPLEFAVTWFAA
jgi:hypothetical protein